MTPKERLGAILEAHAESLRAIQASSQQVSANVLLLEVAARQLKEAMCAHTDILADALAAIQVTITLVNELDL